MAVTTKLPCARIICDISIRRVNFQNSVTPRNLSDVRSRICIVYFFRLTLNFYQFPDNLVEIFPGLSSVGLPRQIKSAQSSYFIVSCTKKVNYLKLVSSSIFVHFSLFAARPTSSKYFPPHSLRVNFNFVKPRYEFRE